MSVRDDLPADLGLGEPEFWFCLKHSAVEGREGCKAKHRLGPYPSEAEAARALDKVAERNEEWDATSDSDDSV